MSRRDAAQAAGFAATVLFALYNGALGLWHGSVWHGSICAYYLLLSLLRWDLLAAARRRLGADRQRRVLRRSSAALFLLNGALTVPAALMVLDRRGVRLGMIPAIASAAYTTYKLIAASVRLKRAGASAFVRQLDRLRFVDALASILVLQNTLLTAVDGAVTGEMLPLAAISSAAILLLILALSLSWLLRDSRAGKGAKFTP